MKLASSLKGKITVWQSPHGALQDGKAMDLSGDDFNIYAPIDGRTERRYGSTHDTAGFHFMFGSYDILFHHAIPTRLGSFRKGDVIGSYLFKDGALHIHTAIKVSGRWDILLSYIDRRTKLVPGGKIDPKWAEWSSYPDKQIILGNNNMLQLKTGVNGKDKVQVLLEITANPTLKLRAMPNTNSKVVGNLKKGQRVSVNTFDTGTSVDGNTLWGKYGTIGWFSMRWAKEVVEDNKVKDLEARLARIKKRSESNVIDATV